MKTHQALLVVVLAVAFVPAMVSGAEIVSQAAGTGTVGGLTEGSPGVPVSLDFTIDPRVNPPAQLVQITLSFSTSGLLFDELKIQLDAGPDIYSFGSPDGRYVNHVLYDPTWGSGSGTIPASELDQLWKDELVDGVLNCHVWVEGVTFGVPDSFSMGAGGSFLVPEPATLGLLGIGGLMLLKRRRRG